MQNPDASLSTIPNQNVKDHMADHIVHTDDKNRIDEIARTSEPGRRGEESVYIPPSSLHPEQSTAQNVFDNPSTYRAGGSYGLDGYMDRDSELNPTKNGLDTAGAESSELDDGHMLSRDSRSRVREARRSVSELLMKGSQEMNQKIHNRPYVYVVGALGVGYALARYLKNSRH